MPPIATVIKPTGVSKLSVSKVLAPIFVVILVEPDVTVPSTATVPVAFGKVIVLSASKLSATVNVNSWASAPSPSKVKSVPVFKNNAVASSVATVADEPFVITLKSNCPSSVPSDTSNAFALILP